MRTNSLRPKLLVLLIAVLALAISACGGDDGDDAEVGDLGPDPATVAPVDAPVYGEVVVRPPEGSMRDDLEAALSTITGQEDIGATITEELESSISEEGYSYSEDIEPWLGPRAGFFATEFDAEAEQAEGAGIVAVTDEEAAQEFVDKVAAEPDANATEQEYEGVSYWEDDEDAAVGIVGEFLVIGTVPAFEATVDASAGESLADDSEATAALETIPEESLFSLYADTPALVELIESSGELRGPELEQLREQISAYSDGPVTAWGTASADSFAFSASAPAPEGGEEPTDLLTSFPADAWFAFAAGNVGDQIATTLEQFEAGFEAGFESSAPGLTAPDPLGEVREATGIDLAEDLSWVGDLGGFVQGTSILGLGGGLVIEATDEQAASSTLSDIEGALERSRAVEIAPASSGEGFSIQVAGAPVGAEIALEDGRVVAAGGGTSVADVLSPSETLADSDRFSSASEALDGLTPAFFLDFAPIVSLVESSGQATADPDYQMAKPYLDRLDYLIAGSSLDGDRIESSFVLGIQEASSADAEAAGLIP